jgi:3',5'-cyclic AMP phosphodiesterase CpdA
MMKKTLVLMILVCSICCITANVSSLTISKPGSVEQRLTRVSPDLLVQSIVASGGNLSITWPRSTAPVILENGDTFSIQFNTSEFTNVYAYITTAYEPVVDTFWLPLESVSSQNNQWSVNASIPENVPDELYNLTILIDSNGRLLSSTQPRSVSVTAISENFTFIHITDFHVGDPRGFTESIRETLGYKSILRCIHEINLLHPDFVVISGDLVFGQLYPNEYAREYPRLYAMLQRFDVPTFIAPGNHDNYRRPGEDGKEIWKSYFGPLYYSFDYGNVHFLAIDSFDLPAKNRLAFGPIAFYWGGSIQDEQLSWIQHDLNQSTQASLKIMLMHHNPLWDTPGDSLLKTLNYKNRPQLLALIDQYDIDMVLAGHVHNDSVNLDNGTIFITTTTPESEIRTPDGYWGYRMIHIQNGHIVSFNYKEPYYSIPSYKLQAEFKTQKKAVVTNDLEMNTTVLLRFILPTGSYSVSPGTIIMERDDGTFKELYLQLVIPKLSQITVQVVQDSSDNK